MTHLFAAILHAGDGEGDALLCRFARNQIERGYRVRGLVTTRSKDREGGLPMQIGDLLTGRTYDISQQLGRGSTACSLDLGALAEASHVLRAAIEERPELIVVNRFGTAESSGRGYAAEIAAVIGAGIPLLTLLSPQYVSAWQEFTGAPDSTLMLDERAVQGWFETLPGVRGKPWP